MKALCIWKTIGPFLSYILEIFPNFVTSFHVIFSQYIKHFLWHLLKQLKKIFPYTKKNSPPERPCFRVDWMEWTHSLWDETRCHRKVEAGCARSLPLTDISVRRPLGARRRGLAGLPCTASHHRRGRQASPALDRSEQFSGACRSASQAQRAETPPARLQFANKLGLKMWYHLNFFFQLSLCKEKVFPSPQCF